VTPDEVASFGLGLAREEVWLAAHDPRWADVAAALISPLRAALEPYQRAIEHIGSTSIPDLRAKPIIDIGILVGARPTHDVLVRTVESLGYLYRGDAGQAGGHVFVLEVTPSVRVAHVHVIRAGDQQWDHYLSFRDRLRRDPIGRRTYEAVKVQLAARYSDDRLAYTNAKDEVVQSLRSGELISASSDDAGRGIRRP
jgi:GrpB-like predicted nucleotidyltransferase (UPF0157 family)